MIKLAFCDDDNNTLRSVSKGVINDFKARGEEISHQEYNSGLLLYEAAQKEGFDLVFLDIEMPEINGFLLAKKLKGILPDIHIVFLSRHDSLVYDSYEYEPLWFIRKKQFSQMLPKVIEKYYEKTEWERQTYQFKKDSGLITVRIVEVKYLECNLHTITVNTINNSFTLYGSLNKLEKEMEPFNFIRVHRNFLVNRRFIYSVKQKTVELTDHMEVPLSKDRRSAVKEKLLNV